MLTADFWRKYFRVYDVLNLCIPYQELVGELVAQTNPQTGERILDAGGGTGNVAMKLAEKGAEVTVFDFSKEALEICNKKNNKIKIICGDLTEKLPFLDNYFDKVVSNNAIYTISPEKRDGTIKEIYRVLKPSGIFVVSNVREGFKPIEIYKEHIKKVIKKDGAVQTIKILLKMAWPTIKMFYYNSLIKKEGAQGSYAFFKKEEQENLLAKNNFTCLSGSNIVYGKQALLTVAKK